MLLNFKSYTDNKKNISAVLINRTTKNFSTPADEFNEQIDYRTYGEVVYYGDGVA